MTKWVNDSIVFTWDCRDAQPSLGIGPAFPQALADIFGDHHRAMLSAGAPELMVR